MFLTHSPSLGTCEQHKRAPDCFHCPEDWTLDADDSPVDCISYERHRSYHRVDVSYKICLFFHLEDYSSLSLNILHADIFMDDVTRPFDFAFFTIRRQFIIGHTITGNRSAASTYIFMTTPIFFVSRTSFSMPEPISIIRNIIAIIQRTIHDFLYIYIIRIKISFQFWNIFIIFSFQRYLKK